MHGRHTKFATFVHATLCAWHVPEVCLLSLLLLQFFDGGSRGNGAPGSVAGYGYVIYADGTDQIVSCWGILWGYWHFNL